MTSERAPLPQPVNQPAQQVNNSGLELRKALISLGHRSGYTQAEIEATAQARGATLPEITFYFSMVREGKVANGPHGDIYASPITADFAADHLEGNPPENQQPGDAVQPLLTHPQWVEIAHDTRTLYAIDLAPGAAGVRGQVIGRPKGQTQIPHLVARSLAQFITGDWVEEIEQVRQEQKTAEGNLADDFSAVALGTNPKDRLERVQKRWENEDDATAAEPLTAHTAPPQTRKEAAELEQEENLPFSQKLKRFFLG